VTDGEGDGPRGGVAALAVDADLDLWIDGVAVEVVSTGDLVLVEVPSLRAAVRVVRGLPAGGESPTAALLRGADLTLEVRVRRTTVAVLGAAARPGPLSRALGADPVEVRAGGLLAAAGRELLDAARTAAARLG
jgi:hypothetical protein